MFHDNNKFLKLIHPAQVPNGYENRLLIIEKVIPIFEKCFALTTMSEIYNMLIGVGSVLDEMYEHKYFHGDCSIYNIGYLEKGGMRQYYLYDNDKSGISVNDIDNRISADMCDLLASILFNLKGSENELHRNLIPTMEELKHVYEMVVFQKRVCFKTYSGRVHSYNTYSYVKLADFFMNQMLYEPNEFMNQMNS